MAQHWPLLAGLIVLLGTNIHFAGAGTCKPATCSPSGGSGLFKYTAGHTYTYNLEGKTLTDLPEQQGEPVKLELKAVAEVNFGAGCTNTLKLSKVQVTGPDAKVYGDLKELEAFPVRFSFNDGVVEPEICSDAEDSNTALNIKRAVISLLQVSVSQTTNSKHEVDIFGSCPTTIKVDKRGAETLITKSRDLNKCAHREDLRNRVPTSDYVTSSDLQSVPILDSNLVVEMTVADGAVKSASSHEIYLYRPFSNRDAGAKTVVHTTITLVNKAAQPAHQCKANAPKSIIFDSPHADSNIRSSPATIVAAMQACKAQDNVQVSAATEFRNLVEVFRSSNKNDILAVYGQVKAGTGFPDKVAARKLFLDALFRAGNGDTVQAAVELLKSNEFLPSVARLWYMSFGFVRHATPESLVAAATVLDMANVPMEAYLGVGSLAAQYCKEHSCEDLPSHTQLLAKMSKPLAGGCKCTSYEQENKVIAALKGIENMKGVNEPTAALLAACIADSTVPARVRVAALETARSDACQPTIKKSVLAVLPDTQEDSEIRIKAYLAAVQCPCGKCANTIKELLDKEPVNQVGAFIVSHLRNVKASTNPDKFHQKHHLSEIRTTRKFPFDVRKFSRNYEVSGLFDAINVGSSVESNVIFSQQSYLPRSTSFNLTTDLFGHSINLLEVNTRAENLERVFESFFGPRGYMNTHDVEDIFNSGKAKLKGLKEKLSARFGKTFRSKRSVPVNALESFRKTLSLHPSDRTVTSFDLNVKMFGSTLGHSSYRGDGREFTADSIVDAFFDGMSTGVDGVKSFNHKFNHNTIFENEGVYPTGTGFPLVMTVSTSAAVSVKLDGKFDIQAILKDPNNAKFQFEIVPSAAVEAMGVMSVNAFAVEAGLKVSSVLHTSTGVNVDVKSVEGTGLDVTVGLPVKKQEVINMHTQLVTYVRERGAAPAETPLAFNTKRKDFQGCFDQLSPYVGLTFCSDIGVPLEGVSSRAAFYPLNGPSKFVLTIESDDVTSYKFRGGLVLKDENRKAIEFLIDTPGSKTNRKIEMIVEAIRKPNHELRVKFASPIKTLNAELVYVNTPTEVSLATMVSEDANEYFIKLGADVSGSENHRTYVPSLDYRFGGEKSEKLTKGKKGKAQKQSQPEYRIEGKVILDKEGDSRKYSFDNINLVLPIGKLGVNGWVAHDKQSISSDLKLAQGASAENSFAVKGKAEKLGPSNFKVKGQVQASQYPDLGGSVDWDYNRQPGELASTLVLVHGSDLSSKQACVTARVHAKYHGTSHKDVDFTGEGSVTYPLLGIVAKIGGDAKPNGFNYAIEGAYEKFTAMSSGHLKVGTSQPGDYDVEFEAKVLENHIKFETKRDIVSPTDNKFTTTLEMTPGGKYELTADTVCKHETGNVVSKVVAVLKMDKSPEPFNFDYALEVVGHNLNAHVKVNQGKSDFVDAAAKFNGGSAVSGNAKVCLLDQLDSALDFSLDATKGALSGNVKLLKLQRTMRVDGKVAIAGTNYNGDIDFLFDESDPTKKIHFETVSDIKPSAIDTKNKLIILSYTTLFNVKGDVSGSITNGHIKGSADITLPSNHHLAGSIDRVLHMKQPEADGSLNLELSFAEKRGGPATSIVVDGKADKCNRGKGFFDVDFSVVYKNVQGKDIAYKLAGKHLPDGENRHVELQGQIKGSLIDVAPMALVKVDVVKPVVSYTIKANIAADSNIELVGKAQSGADGSVPYLLENNLDVNLPTGELKSVKVVESWSFVKGTDGAPCELKGMATATYNGANTVKIDAELKGSAADGQGKLTLSMPQGEPRVLKGTYVVAKGPGIEREMSLTASQGAKEGSVQLKVKVPADRKSFHVSVDGRSNVDNFKNFGLVADTARNDKSVESEATFTINEKKAVVSSKVGLDWRSPVFEVSVVHPKGKTAVGFHFLPKAGSAHHYESEVRYEHNGDVGFGKADVLFPSVHEFTVTIDADSPRLKINQVHLVVTNQPGVKGGKSITVTQTEAGQPTVNGKLAYTFKDGSDGAVFEATGNLKVKGEDRATKIIVKKTVYATGGENGVQYTLTSTLGDQSIEGIFKQTNKEMRLMGKGCHKAGSCGHADYNAKYSIHGLDFNSEVTAEIDVTGLGLNTDIAFKRITEKKGKEFLHKVDFTSKNKQLFSFKVGFNDKGSTVCLITPTREMAVDSSYSLVADPKNSRHYTYKCETNAWLDRAREPAAKSSAVLEIDYVRTDNSVTVSSEAKFGHPALGKDMIVKGTTTVGGRQLLDSRVELDLFAKKGQKITIDGKVGKSQIAGGYNFTSTWDIKSKGQNLDIVAESHVAASTNLIGFGSSLVYTDEKGARDLGFGLEAGLHKAVVFMKAPNDVLVDYSSTTHWNKGLPSVEAFLALAGCKGVVGKAHLEEGGKFLYSIYKKDEPTHKIAGVTVLDFLTKAHTQLSWYNGPDAKQLWSLGFDLDEKIVPDVDFSFDHMKTLIGHLRDELKKFVDNAKKVGQGIESQAKGEMTDLADSFKKSQPNLKPLIAAYQAQLKAIRSEIADDKNVKELADVVKAFAAPASEVFAQVLEVLTKIADKALDIFDEFSSAIIGSLKRIMPKITESCSKISAAATDIFHAVATRALNGLQALVDVCKKHEPELKKIATAIADISRDIYRSVGKTMGHICKELKDFVSVIYDQVKAMPVFSMIQERLTDVKLQLKETFPLDAALRVLNEVTQGLSSTLPTQELRDFVECVSAYFEKLLKQQKVDHTAETKKMYQKGIAAYKSVVLLIRAEGAKPDASHTSFFAAAWKFVLNTAFRIPRWASVHLSPLHFIQLDDLPDFQEYLTTYSPRSFHPDDIIPPFRSYGMVIDNSHFYTFDKRHFTFAGGCSYVLAQDSNGYFSLVLNLEKDKYKSLQLTDGKDTLEVTAQQTLLLNGQPIEYPYAGANLFAWRRYHTIHMKSSAGIQVVISPDFHVTMVQLSGYYHGQVRGLLGDANYEEFDDFRLPSGKICTDAAEFGNAYQVGPKCAPGTTVGHNHQHAAECTTLFSANSPLRPAFAYVEPETFRDACDHFVTETTTKKQEYACRVAAAYAQMAAKHGQNVKLPDACATCEAPGKNMKIGDILSMKAPSQKADVVIILEQVTGNAEIYKDLVSPLVATLTTNLKGKGITDVSFHLIGYGHPKQKWPAHHTTNGHLAFDGNCKLEFGEPQKQQNEWGKTKEEHWAYIKRKLQLEVGFTKLSEAIIEAAQYPYRAGATKAILLVTGSRCEKGLAFGLQKLGTLLAQKVAQDQGISVHIVSPMDGFKISGSKDAAVQKGVVGFDSNYVYSFADGKKKNLDGAGNGDLRNDIEFNQDVCIDITQATNGAAYNAHNFLEAKGGQRKQFVQVVSSKLTQALSTPYTEECRCVLKHELFAETRCRILERKSSEQTETKTKKGGGGKKPKN